MLVEESDDGTVTLRPAVTVPANEAWLWKNSKALGAVTIGLAEARGQEFVEGPDIAADAADFGVED